MDKILLSTFPGLIFALIVTNIVNYFLWPKLFKREIENNIKAGAERSVFLDKLLSTIFILASLFLSIIGFLVIFNPQICVDFGFDYTITIIALWIPLIFDLIMIPRFLIRINYNEDVFKYTNAIGLTKTYKYSDIVEIIDNGRNVKIITAKKKIVIYNALSGVKPFLKCIKENRKAS